MDVKFLLHKSRSEKLRSTSRDRGRRCIIVAALLTAATLVYLCGVTDPFAETRPTPHFTNYATTEATTRPENLSLAPPKVQEIEPEEVSFVEQQNADGFLVDTLGCRIPDLTARNVFVAKYINDPEPDPKCSKQAAPLIGNSTQRGPPLVESNVTSLWIVHSALPHYGVHDISSVECCYRSFSRRASNPKQYDTDADDRYNVSKKCVAFKVDSAVNVEKDIEFVRVECSVEESIHTTNLSRESTTENGGSIPVKTGTSRQIYLDFHAFVPSKQHVEERCKKVASSPDEVSVLILGIDAVSRLNMLRELPLLHEVLSSPPLSAISLLGYNKVGDNTFPNVMSILTGLPENQLESACPWPSARHKLDPCPFVWKTYAKRGYRTVYGEDCTWMSTFNYAKTGFVDEPTDYYPRPFLLASEHEQGHTKRWNVKLCVGPRLALHNILDYAEKFSLRFASEKYFGFFWTNSVSHDFLTMPHNGDVLYSRLLQHLVETNAINRTVIMIISDHGIRWGQIRETYQGRMEERLPFAFLAFPRWFQERFPTAIANVRRNARRLTTPFDIYHTLVDLLDPTTNLRPHKLRARSLDILAKARTNGTTTAPKKQSPATGISLFLEIPKSRSCKDAFIPPHFCTCEESTPLSIDDTSVQRAVRFVLDDLNARLRKYRQCSQLALASIHSAQRNVPKEEKISMAIVDYVVTFETNPSKAVFEATVRETPTRNNTNIDLQLAGIVSRINQYGNQSRCVSDFHMKLYCYCT